MKIVVYSKPNCRACTMSKRELDKLNIQYESIENTPMIPEAMEKLKANNIQSFPAIFVGDGDNETHFSGYLPEKLSALAAS